MAADSQPAIERYSRSDVAPNGEWWAEFLVGLSLEEEESVNQPVNRLIDGICVTSRQPNGVRRLYRDKMREKRESGWLDGEQVVLVEYGRGKGSWAKYGQLDVRRRMFERDWEHTTVEAAQVVMKVNDPKNYGREDTEWIFENELEDYEYIVEYEGRFYPYSSFIELYC